MTSRGMRPRAAHFLLLLLLIYWAVSLAHLTVLPPIYEDESWQASTGWQLATERHFASDLFAGWNGMERRYYGYMPLHSMLQGGLYRLAGLGLFQSRFLGVALGLLILVLTFSLGRRLWGPRYGLLAVAFLILAVTTTRTPSQLSGILLVDIGRINRYDMLVPLFGLATFHAIWSAQRGNHALYWWGAAGALAGLAGLSHLYGLFIAVSAGVLAVWMRAGWRALVALVVGVVLVWLPYIAYVLADLPTWRAQTALYGPRFELLNPRWYVDNLLAERQRYAPGDARTALWAGPALALALLALGRRAREGEERAMLVLVPAVLLPALFGLLITIKLINYRVLVEPLWALVGAWGALTLWRWLRDRQWGRWGQGVVLLLAVAGAAEGAARLVAMQHAAAAVTPYPALVAQLRDAVPEGATVLGMHHYWLGMEETDFRAWIVPIARASGQEDEGAALRGALDDLDPEVVIIEREIREYLDFPPPGDPVPAAAWGWLRIRGYHPTVVIDDATYGRVELWMRREQ